MKKKQSSITVTIAVIIIVGFILSLFSSVLSFQVLFKKDIEAVSQLTSENISANIDNLMNRPIHVAMTMANDSLLKDYMIQEENVFAGNELQTLQSYLATYQERYKFDSVFLVSTKTNAYYHYQNGVDRFMNKEVAEDQWFYQVIESDADCSLNVDNDETKNNVITVFVNCKIYDDANNLIGIVGVGLETSYIQQYIVESENEYDIKAFLIDDTGNVKLSSSYTEFENVNLFDSERYQDMSKAIKINKNTTSKRWYESEGVDGYVITKYVPNLNWYLVIEKNIHHFQADVIKQMWINLIFMIIVVFFVVRIVMKIIKNFNTRLVDLAEIDQLTGLNNRRSYERAIASCTEEFNQYSFFGICIFDLNKLKSINDQYGHQVGDEYIKSFANLLKDSLPEYSIFRIGGDEFALILKNIPEFELVKQLEQLFANIKVLNKKEGIALSVAYGYSFKNKDTLDTIHKIFKDADDKMYANKDKYNK